MLTADLDYVLPAGRIAQSPAEPRDAAKLLHLRPDGTIADHIFRDLPRLLRPGDLLVGNDTRVRRARLLGDAGGFGAELLVLEAKPDGTHVCLSRPARRLRRGATVRMAGGALVAHVLGNDPAHPGAKAVRFDADGADIDAAIEAAGTAPLPPYIHSVPDPERYQTVYASGAPVSAAAPTAGLHFTQQVMAALAGRGVAWATVTLDVGLGTFVPIKATTVSDHVMHEERCAVPRAAAQAIAAARSRGGRVIAVGTTVVRTLESRALDDGTVEEGGCNTRLFITPGHRFRAVDGLVTNFHQPRSSLLALLAAFVGAGAWRAAYWHALEHDYRFLSFGDCMLCWAAG